MTPYTFTRDIQGRPWAPCPQCPRRRENGGDGSECVCASRRHRFFCDHVAADPAKWAPIVRAQPPETRPPRVVPGVEPIPVWPRPDGRVRVGFIGPCYYDSGGTERWHRTLLPRLAGVQVVGYAVLAAGAHPAPLPCPLGVGTPSLRSLAASVDVLVTWGLGSELGPILAGLTRPPAVVWVSHGDGPWTRAQATAAASHVAHWVAVSAAAVAPLAGLGDVTTINNAIDPAAITTTRPRSEVRSEWGIESAACPHRIACLAVARLSGEKHLETLAAAVGPLAPPYQLIVAGEGPERANLEGRPGVLLLGSRDDVAGPLAAADLYLSASATEGFGLATAEAMAMDVPVISTPVGFLAGHPELARIVPVGSSPEVWAAAIRADWQDELGRLARAERARRFVFEHFDATAWANSWQDYLLALVPARPDPEQAVYPHPGPDGQPTTPPPPPAVASEEVRQARLAVCRTCDRLLPSGKCAACGCAGTTAERAASVYGVCPLGRWPPS